MSRPEMPRAQAAFVRISHIAIVIAIGGGCGSDTSSQGTAPITSNQNEPASASPRYEVHEWGLATGQIQMGGLRVATLPTPPPPDRSMRPRAPILYVHLLDDAEITFDATVTIPDGIVQEHWPNATAIEHGVRWTEVRAEPGTCSGTYPALTSPECARAPGDCEVARLAPFETDDGACLTVAGETYNNLFYRGEVPSPTLPLSCRLGSASELVVTNRDAAPIGQLIRILRTPTEIRVTMAPMPGPGESATLPTPTVDDDLERARASVGVTLRELGMTEPESQAFQRAWQSELFGPTGEARPVRRVFESLLYWLPEASADELAMLAFEPAPERVRRAIMVRIQLRGR